MKILHINSNYIYTKLHQLLIDHLNANNVDNVVFVPVHYKEQNHQDINNIFVRPCFNNIDRFLFHIKQHKIFSCIRNTITMNDFDIIHAYTLFTDGNVARNLSKQYGIPYVVAVRNTDVNIFFRKRFMLRKLGVDILKDAKKIFFLSDTYKELVLSKYVPADLRAIIKSKSIVISNGIDNFWLDNKNVEQKVFDKHNLKIVFAGSIDKNKNVSATIQAIHLLREKYNITFNVVGKIVDEKEFYRIKKERCVNYYKQKPKEQLIKIYRESDLFVMPSIFESFGLVYAEAMSQGLPVIYSEGQGFDKQFPEGLIGYHVNALSPKSIADGIEKVLDNYETISKNAIIYVEKFRWEKIAKKYVSIYETINR